MTLSLNRYFTLSDIMITYLTNDWQTPFYLLHQNLNIIRKLGPPSRKLGLAASGTGNIPQIPGIGKVV